MPKSSERLGPKSIRPTGQCLHPFPDGKFAVSVDAKPSERRDATAVEFFMLDWWKGPKPKVGMTLRIVGVYRPFELKMRVTEDMMSSALAKKRGKN